MLGRSIRCICGSSLIALIVAPGICQGADVLNELPDDALGFVLVRNVGVVDGKIGQLAASLQRNLPQPLGFLKDVTGIGDGLDTTGDFLLAFLPGPEGNEPALRFGVWLPVKDYGRFLKSLKATSIEGVAAVTVAGEDLLVARCGKWALTGGSGPAGPNRRVDGSTLAAGIAIVEGMDRRQ